MFLYCRWAGNFRRYYVVIFADRRKKIETCNKLQSKAAAKFYPLNRAGFPVNIILYVDKYTPFVAWVYYSHWCASNKIIYVEVYMSVPLIPVTFVQQFCKISRLWKLPCNGKILRKTIFVFQFRGSGVHVLSLCARVDQDKSVELHRTAFR